MNEGLIIHRQLFGYYSGLGMSVLTFDWGMISYIGSPLATPWWAEGELDKFNAD